jgi:IPT/TIG domain
VTYALVGTPVSNSTASSVSTLTATYSPTAGNGVLVIYCYQNANVVNVTSIQNQSGTALTYVQVAAVHDNASYGGIAAFWLPNVPSGITGIKLNTDTAAGIGMTVLEYSGLWTSNAAAGVTAPSSFPTATTATDNLSVSVTPTQQPGMLFALALDLTHATVLTAGTGFTARTNASYTLSFGSLVVRTEDKRITSTSAVNATFTNGATTGDAFEIIAFVIPEPPAAPALTTGVPTSGSTLATSSTVTCGATTTVGSGTLYCVATTSSLSGVTAAQVKAGQNAAGSTTGVFSSNGAVSATGAVTCPQLSGLTASTTYNYAVVQNATGGDSNIITGTFTTHAPVPTISNLTPSPLVDGSSATLTGTTFGSTKGTGHADIGGVAQTTTSWADTSIAMTVAIGTNKYGASVSVTVTNNAGDASAGWSTTINPPTGWQYVDLATPYATAGNRVTSSADLASGDQIAWGNVTGSGTVTVFSDGTFVADGGVTGFDFKIWTSGSGYGSVGTQTLSSPAVVAQGVGGTVKASLVGIGGTVKASVLFVGGVSMT